MSSMRNAVQRRPHKERAQPLERRRLGLLEKHKDYSLRAADYNKKKATLKSLREKAAERNDDEFYFGMMSRKGPGSKLKDGKRWVGTVQGDRGNKAMDVETVRLLKTQDLGYVRTMKQVAAKELARLQEKVVLARGLDWLAEEEEGGEEEDDEDEDEDEEGDEKRGATVRAKGPRKIVFLDDEAEREILLDQLSLKNNNDADNDADEANANAKDDQKAQRQKDIKNLKRELEHARKKVRVLEAAENELEIQQTKMAKTATSGGFTRRGKKIMVRRRKR